jgi:hypothetical protein
MVALCEAAAELGAQSHIVSITMRANAAEALHPPFPELYGVDTPIQFQNYRLPGMRVDGEANYVAVLRLMAYFWHMIKPDTFCRLRAAPLVVLSARNASVLALLVC